MKPCKHRWVITDGLKLCSKCYHAEPCIIAIPHHCLDKWPEQIYWVPTTLLLKCCDPARMVEASRDTLRLAGIRNSINKDGIQRPLVLLFGGSGQEIRLFDGHHRLTVLQETVKFLPVTATHVERLKGFRYTMTMFEAMEIFTNAYNKEIELNGRIDVRIYGNLLS